jgi:hypothetical protein
MRALFNKIDADTDDKIDWDDFSEFMLLRAEGQKQMREESETQLFVVDGQDPHPTPHRDFICKILYSPSARRFVTVSRDSTIAYWSDTLRLQRSFKNVGYVIFQITVDSPLLITQRHRGRYKMDPKKTPPEQQTVKSLMRQRWVQDFALMEPIYSIAIATDDHEISIYGRKS